MESYKFSFALIGRGCRQIISHAAYDMVRWAVKGALAIYHHPLLSCLALSLLLNIVLVVAVVERSYAYWNADTEIMKLENQNDSLRHAEIRYERFNPDEL